jgi:hypothetical protein
MIYPYTKFHIPASSSSDFESAVTKYYKVAMAFSDIIFICAKFCKNPSFCENTAWEGTHMDSRMDTSESLKNYPRCLYIITEEA